MIHIQKLQLNARTQKINIREIIVTQIQYFKAFLNQKLVTVKQTLRHAQSLDVTQKLLNLHAAQ